VVESCRKDRRGKQHRSSKASSLAHSSTQVMFHEGISATTPRQDVEPSTSPPPAYREAPSDTRQRKRRRKQHEPRMK